MRALAFATAVALILAGPALAEGPMTTAPVAGPGAPQPTAPSPPLPTDEAGAVADQGPQMAMGPCGPEKVKADGTLETKPHGEVEVGVGTGGYRHAAGYVCQPIGQNAAIAVGVSQTQYDQGHRRR